MAEQTTVVASGTASLYAALVKAQKTAQAVGKDSKNSFHNYKYASAEDIIAEARSALSSAGLALFCVGWNVREGAPYEGTNKKGETITLYGMGRIYVHYRLAHESGETLDFEGLESAVIPEAGRPEDKAEATALTYNLGYFLRGLLLLPRAEEGANPDARDDRNYQPAEKPKPPPKAAPQTDPASEALTDEYLQAVAQAKDEAKIKAMAAAAQTDHKAHKLNDLQLAKIGTALRTRKADLGIGASA